MWGPRRGVLGPREVGAWLGFGTSTDGAKHTPKPPLQPCPAQQPRTPGTATRKDARTDVHASPLQPRQGPSPAPRPLGYLGPNLLGLPMRPQLLDEAQGAREDVVLVHGYAEAGDGGGPRGAWRLPAARAGRRLLLHAP